MKIEQKGAVLTVRMGDIASGWDWWLGVMSDNHHDSPHCNRKLESKHLQMVKDRGGMVIVNGDLFDAMQGKFDPRRSLSDVRPEDRTADYYGSIVTNAADDYAPYAEQFLLIAKGNHETAVLDKANTDLTSNLVYRMNNDLRNAGKNHRIACGGYAGWIRFMFTSNGTRRQTYKLKYSHGSGGSAPVTRGMIDTARQGVWLPDADIVCNGHNHQSYTVAIGRERLTSSGRVTTDLSWYIRSPGYKNEWGDGSSGFAVERTKSGPTPNGMIWLHFYYDTDRVKFKPIQEVE